MILSSSAPDSAAVGSRSPSNGPMGMGMGISHSTPAWSLLIALLRSSRAPRLLSRGGELGLTSMLRPRASIWLRPAALSSAGHPAAVAVVTRSDEPISR